jgi:hypothetical protein
MQLCIFSIKLTISKYRGIETKKNGTMFMRSEQPLILPCNELVGMFKSHRKNSCKEKRSSGSLLLSPLLLGHGLLGSRFYPLPYFRQNVILRITACNKAYMASVESHQTFIFTRYQVIQCRAGCRCNQVVLFSDYI